MLLLRAKCQYKSHVAVSHFSLCTVPSSYETPEFETVGLNDSSFPGPILTYQAPSLHKLPFAPDITKMGPSLAAWMTMSDWKPHRPQGWFRTGRPLQRDCMLLWRTESSTSACLTQSSVSICTWAVAAYKQAQAEQTCALILFTTNLLSDPKSLPLHGLRAHLWNLKCPLYSKTF